MNVSRIHERIRRSPSVGFGVVGWAVVAVLFGSAGCDSRPSATSDRVVIGPAEERTTPADESNAKIVTMLTPFGGRNVEIIIWKQAAMEEMGRHVGEFGAILDVRSLTVDDPPERQAEMVREAVARGSSALIVVAADPKLIAPALLEARDKGVHVILLSRPVPVEGKPPFPLVSYPGFDEPAKKLLAVGRLVARDRKIADDAPAMILAHEPKDDHTDLRIAALKKALEDAKIPLLAEERFEEYPEKAKAVIVKVMKKHPNLGYILADEDQAIEATTSAHEVYDPEKPPVVVGFIWNQSHLSLLRSGDVAAVVNRRVQAGAARAVKAAIALCRGRPLPDLHIQPNVEQPNDPIDAARNAVKSLQTRSDQQGR